MAGVALWGLHMGMTQGLLAALVTSEPPHGATISCVKSWKIVAWRRK
jgi:hypothetical protein